MGHHVFDSSRRWVPFKEKYLAEHSEDCHVVTKRQARYMASYYRHRTPSIQMHPGEQHQSTQHRPTLIAISLALVSYKTCRSTVSNPLNSPPVQLCQVGILAAQLLHLAWLKLMRRAPAMEQKWFTHVSGHVFSQSKVHIGKGMVLSESAPCTTSLKLPSTS